MYKRILVATGGSPWSDAAVAYAIRLAAHTAAELRILTVLTVPAIDMAEVGAMACNKLLDSIEQDGKSRLTRAASRATWAGVAYDTLLEWGPIPQRIVQTADAENCDVIILGSRLLKGWKRLRLGSIVNTVAATAQQPVLVVKQATPLTPQALCWRRMLVATGGSAWSDAAVEHALRLAQTHQSEVCLLHVAPAWSSRHHAGASVAGTDLLAEAVACAAAAGVAYTARIAHGDVVTAIVDTATRYTAGSRRYDNFLAYIPADLIVIYSGQDMRVRHDGAPYAPTSTQDATAPRRFTSPPGTSTSSRPATPSAAHGSTDSRPKRPPGVHLGRDRPPDPGAGPLDAARERDPAVTFAVLSPSFTTRGSGRKPCCHAGLRGRGATTGHLYNRTLSFPYDEVSTTECPGGAPTPRGRQQEVMSSLMQFPP